MARPRLALTVGDPAGIGPEIVLKALDHAERPDADWVVYGPRAAVDERARRFGLRPLDALGVDVVNVGGEEGLALGCVSASSGQVSAEAVLRAARDAVEGRLEAVVTAPLNKKSLHAAGHHRPGHTELLAHVAGVSDVAMMFVGGGLRVALLTIHRSLRSVPEAITQAEVSRIGRLLHRELPRFGFAKPDIGFCGVNPHGGEGGLLGREEIDVIEPAIEALRGEGVAAHGPFAADTLFLRAARGEFDVVVAAYHDQGLVPVKLAAFGRAVNVTLGLPFVRTSVDHGTAFDIVHRGVADAGSLLEAMKLAATLVGPRPDPTA